MFDAKRLQKYLFQLLLVHGFSQRTCPPGKPSPRWRYTVDTAFTRLQESASAGMGNSYTYFLGSAGSSLHFHKTPATTAHYHFGERWLAAFGHGMVYG